MTAARGPRRGQPYRVLVHCDDRRRDAPTIWALKLLLEGHGFRVLVSNRRTLRGYERWFEPQVIVLSHAVMPYSPDELKNIARRAKLIVLPTEGALFSRKSVIVSYGGATVLDGADKRRAHTQYIDRVLMWGRANAKAVLEEGIYTDRQIGIVGNPRYDVYKSGYFERLRSASGQKVCGFANSVNALNPFDRRNPVEFFDHVRLTGPGNNFDLDKSVEDYYWYLAACLRLQLEFAYAFPRLGVRLSLRPHIYEYAPGYEFLAGRVPNLELGSVREPFYAWLARICALVVVKSTAVVEGFITRTPVISLMRFLTSFDRHLGDPDVQMPMLRYCHAPSSLDEAVEMAKEGCLGSLEPASVTDPGLSAFLRDYYNWPSNDFTLLEVVRHVREVLGDDATMTLDSQRRSVSFLAGLRLLQAKEYLKYQANWCRSRLCDGGLLGSNFYVMENTHFYPWNREDCLEGESLQRDLRPLRPVGA